MEEKKVKIANKVIGANEPCFIIAEIGINHNGSVDIAKKMIDVAKTMGCDAVKFQKRTIDVVYTKEELDMPRESIFGTTNRCLKEGLELDFDSYCEIDRYCKERDILWFASCWDEGSVDFIEQFDVPCYKVASASLTDDDLLKYIKSKKRPVLLSTGMSSLAQIDHAISILGDDNLVLYHTTSTYPTDLNEINLNVIKELKERYNCPIGYSGHERGVMPSVLAVAYGAVSVERHITLDRTMFGSDQVASLEPQGLYRLVRDIRQVPIVSGDGVKKVYNSELPIIKKLRRKTTVNV